jgi:hypothetical protein
MNRFRKRKCFASLIKFTGNTSHNSTFALNVQCQLNPIGIAWHRIWQLSGCFRTNICLRDQFLFYEYKNDLRLKFGTFHQFLINRRVPREKMKNRDVWSAYLKLASLTSLQWQLLHTSYCGYTTLTRHNLVYENGIYHVKMRFVIK